MLDPKRELVRGWLVRAEHDLAAARKLAEEPESHLDTAIYHCQQAAEKAAKGYLAWRDQPLQRTHDITALVAAAEALEGGFASWRVAAARLTPYATQFRYPGGPLEPTRAEFDQALRDATRINGFVLSLLPHDMRPG